MVSWSHCETTEWLSRPFSNATRRDRGSETKMGGLKGLVVWLVVVVVGFTGGGDDLEAIASERERERGVLHSLLKYPKLGKTFFEKCKISRIVC
jgi:hypothetical protein